MAHCVNCGNIVTSTGVCLNCSKPGAVPPPPPVTYGSPSYVRSNESTAAMWCQLSLLLGNLLALLLTSVFIGFAVLALLWLPAFLIWKKFPQSQLVVTHAKEAINFYLFWVIVQVGLGLLAALTVVFTFGITAFILGAFLVVAGVFQIVVMILASVAGARSQLYRYPLVLFRIVR